MKLSKLNVLEAIKEHYENDHDDLPLCMPECNICEMSDACYKLDRLMDQLFGNKEEAAPKEQRFYAKAEVETMFSRTIKCIDQGIKRNIDELKA